MAFERAPKCFKNDPQCAKSYKPPAVLVRTWHTVAKGGKEGWKKLAEKYGVPAENIIMLNFPCTAPGSLDTTMHYAASARASSRRAWAGLRNPIFSINHS